VIGMEKHVWRVWLISGALLSSLSVFMPDSMWWFAAATAGVGLLSAVVAVTGTVLLRRPLGLAWLFVALAVAGNASGSIVEAFYIEVLHDNSWPSPAVLFYLTLYPFLSMAITLLIRQRARRHQWSHFLDALTITAGAGLLAWVVLIQSALHDPSASMRAQLANVASPILDVVIIAALTRLLLRGGWRAPALRLLTCSIGLFLLCDVAWTLVNQMGWDPGPVGGKVLTLIPLLGYVVAAAAPLHPSAAYVAEHELAPKRQLSPLLLVMLSLACLVSPVILLVQASHGQVTDGVAIGISAAFLTVLVVARMADLVRRLEAQSAQLEELALEDPLTGLPNRRALAARLPTEMERARREPHSLAIVLLDLDHFKQFNDTYGHSAGDSLLCTASAQWQAQLRPGDLVARIGGEEFLVLLPGVDVDAAQDLVSRLQQANPLAQTFSAGIAVWDGQELSQELIERADAAMYEAKTTGRARSVVSAGVKPAWPLEGSGVTFGTIRAVAS
jgi:diguanylate cyclase (GGDEF)-like protein